MKPKGIKLLPMRKIMLMTIDMTGVLMVYIATDIFFMINTSRPSISGNQKIVFGLMLLSLIFVFRLLLGIYSSIWRYANSYAFIRLLVADAIGGLLFIVITHYIPVFRDAYFTRWTKIALISVITMSTLLSRFIYQLKYSHENVKEKRKENIKNVAIIGAGQIGAMLANEMRVSHNSQYNPYCFVDIDRSKVGNTISGVEVLDADRGIINKLKSLPIDEIIIALPKITAEERETIYNFYRRTGLPIKIYDFALGDYEYTDEKRVIRDINLEDLLFREPVNVLNEEAVSFYMNKRVLVTGGGGSIGSEICRQIAKYRPEQLIIIDVYENNAYDIQQDLIMKHGSNLNLAVEVASVRYRDQLDYIFEKYKPQIVFHAAAYKHVPFMETSPDEAVKNNIFGTYNTADMAEKHGVEKFIFISTDKAVNPTSVMGATKRFCEMIVQSRHDSTTSFAAVRFGNVLGSNGSVIPLFKKQIETGGPVTITDFRIVRYFMTISEASQLVIQAGIMAGSGELFVLDMGNAVRIKDLAENMVRLSGLSPYIDIDIVEIGLRPGEKLYEELLIKGEKQIITKNEKIFIEIDSPHSREDISKGLEVLEKGISQSKDAVRDALKQLIPSFIEPSEANGNKELICD